MTVKKSNGLTEETLDLTILKPTAKMGLLHGFGIGRRLEQVAAGSLGRKQLVDEEPKWLQTVAMLAGLPGARQ